MRATGRGRHVRGVPLVLGDPQHPGAVFLSAEIEADRRSEKRLIVWALSSVAIAAALVLAGSGVFF